MIIKLAGPEIVTVDLDTYKVYNQKTPEVNIAIYACWFDASILTSLNPTVDVVWRGYKYTILLSDLITNSSCCDNLVLKLKVDLNNNALEYEKLKYMPVITEYKTPDKLDYNISFGFIKISQSEFNNRFINARR